MATSDKTPGSDKPVKAKTKFGISLSKLSFGKNKPSGPTPEEIDRQAKVRLDQDRQQVVELKNRLLAVGAVVPVVIESALTADHSRLPPKIAVQEGRKLVDAALLVKDAVTAYLRARLDLVGGRDQGGLLNFGSHPLVAKFTKGLDHIQTTADNRWAKAANAAEAAQQAEFLSTQVAGAVRLRGEVHAELERADQEIKAAEAAIEKVSGMGSVDVSAVRQKVTAARNRLAQAAQRSDIAGALEALAGWRDDLASQTKGQSKALDQLGAYKTLRQSVLDQIGKASVLRGATEDTPLRALLNSARIDLGLADEAMARHSAVDQAMELLGEHKGLLDRAKRIDAELKKRATADQTALPKYTDALQALMRARDEIAGLPGASQQLKEADSTLALARLGKDGQPPGGYAAALELLRGKADALLNQAREASRTLDNDRQAKFPGLPKARQSADAVMLKFINAHPPEQAGAQREALAQAVSQDDPIAALAALVDRWNQAVDKQREVDQTLFAEIERMRRLLQELQTLGAPESVLNALRNTDVVDRLRQGNDYARALELARRATKAADDYKLVAVNVNTAWEQAVIDLGEIITSAGRWAAWPPLKRQADGIAGDAQRTLDAVAGGADRQEALEAVKRIRERAAALQLLAGAQNLDPQMDLAAYDKAVKKARADWTKAIRPVQQALEGLAEALTQAGAGPSAADTTWHRQFASLKQRWEHALDHPVLAQGQAPQDALAETVRQFTAEAGILAQAASAALSDDGALGGLVGDAKAQDKQSALRALHLRLADKVLELETAGAKVKAFWEMLGREFDPALATRFGDKWKQLEGVLDKTLQGRREELLAQRKDLLKQADALDKRLNSLISYDQVRFEGFFDDLRGRAADARAMVNSDDPSLMAAGQRQLDELDKTLSQARKGNGSKDGGEGAKTFDDVADLWAALSGKVGQEVLMKRLPATYNRLHGELKAATAKAKTLAPAQGWPLLEALRGPIEDALAQAGVVAERYSIFKARMAQLEDKLVELHKLTATRFTEKTEAYNARFASRLSEAKQKAKTEGQLDAAFDMLDVLDKELMGLMASPHTARTELQKLDGEAAAEQRELRDMARLWEQQRLYWSDTLLPQVSHAMASRGEEKMTEYEDLKAAVSRTEAPLKGYLAVISSLPHEHLAANPSPDMTQARAAFATAQGRLLQMQKVANRLIQGGGSTNVDLVKDLSRLENEWVQRVERLQGAFARLADSIRALPDQAGTDQSNAETYLDSVALSQLRTATAVLGRSIPAAAARFPATAFASPLAVLRSASSSTAERKRAREDALRTMRRLRSEIVDGELFKKLFEGAHNGVLGVDVRPEIGLLRASLKKIELAVLVAA